MDPDEAQARMLQEEELRAVMQSQLQLQQARMRGGTAVAASPETADFANRLQSMLDTALQCEDKALQERARAVIPLSRLRAAADASAALAARMGPDVAAPSREDLLAKGLLMWFKTEFFTWVDTLPCSLCGSSATHHHGGAAQPLPDELAGGAHRVELHRCSHCGGTTRFPRYNDPGRLLQPGCRRGRCGEWANAFLLCCRAAGLTARYVSDWSDHVWTEYYSHSMCRWIHMDSCEASYDQPLLYEAGWGKAVSYVVAAGVWGMVDVTRRYTSRWQHEVLPRRTRVPERWLKRRLDDMTMALRSKWLPPKRLAWLGRDVKERLELLRASRPTGHSGDQQPLPGRQTGSLDWREQRGETGSSGLSSTAAATATAAAARPPTTYRLSPDAAAHMPPVFAAAGRLSGGACRAAGHNETTEVVECLFDGRTDTKWLDFGGAGPGGSSWVEYRMLIDQEPVVVMGYELVSANDCPERDPTDWRLEAVTEQDFTDGSVDAWTELDRRLGVRFPDRHMPLAFHLQAPSPPCRRLRLSISATANPRLANSVQLACWNLYGPVPKNSSSSSTNSPLQALRDMAANAAAAAAVDPTDPKAPGGSGAAAATVTALALLVRLLENICREPQAFKFRKVRYVKVSHLFQVSTLAEIVLGYLRFRPLIALAAAADGRSTGSGTGGYDAELLPGVPAGQDVFLVLAKDTTGDDLRRASEVLSILKP